MEMKMCLRILIWTVIIVVVVDARSVSDVVNSSDGFETAPVRSPDTYGPNQHEPAVNTNNNRGFNRGQGHTHNHDHRMLHTENFHQHSNVNDQFTEHSNCGAAQESADVNFELQNGNRKYKVQSNPDRETEQRKSNVKTFNGGFDQTQNTDYDSNRRSDAEFDNQRKSVQGNYELSTQQNTYLRTKAPEEVFDGTYKTVSNQNNKNSDLSHVTQNRNFHGNVKANDDNNYNQTKEEVNLQNNGKIKQTLAAVSNDDNKPKTIRMNITSGQHTKTEALDNQNRKAGTLKDQNMNKGNYNTSDTDRSAITGRPVPTISDKDNVNINQPKVTQDNEVTPKTNQGRMIPGGSTQNQDGEGDRWIWMDGGEKGMKVTTVSSTTIDLNDRAAFEGSKCPTGQVRFGNACVDEH